MQSPIDFSAERRLVVWVVRSATRSARTLTDASTWCSGVAEPSSPKALPVIVPLVLSNDERPWSRPKSLSELYAAPSEVLVALGPHLLDVTLRIDDLPA